MSFNDNLQELKARQLYQSTRNQQTVLSRKATNYSRIGFENPYYSQLKIPRCFSDRILAHVVAWYLHNNHFFTPPLYLAVEGQPGEGKTSQAIGTCIQHNIEVLYISASQLSGSHERESLDIMESVYQEGVALREQGINVAMVIDDFHLSNASQDENIKRTINSTLLTAYLMNLADDNSKERIPVILTGNDYSKIYEPLLRSGRADRFVWAPDKETRKLIVKNMLQSYVQGTDAEFNSFFERFSQRSISDFAQLRNDCRKRLLLSEVIKYDKLERTITERIADTLDQKLQKISYSDLEELAIDRMNMQIHPGRAGKETTQRQKNNFPNGINKKNRSSKKAIKRGGR